MRGASLLLGLALWPTAALAGLTETQIAQVVLTPPPAAQVSLDLTFKTSRRTRDNAWRSYRRPPNVADTGRLHLHADLRTGAVDCGKRVGPDRIPGRAGL